MSIISSRHSHVSSILKTGSIRSKLNNAKTTTKVRFQLPHSKKVKKILKNYLKGNDLKDYENLVVLIRDSDLFDDDVQSLLREASQCISILGQDLRLFVEALLSVKWTHRSEHVIRDYQSFIYNLLTAHNYHTKFALDKLISNFLPDPSEPEWENGIPRDEDLGKCVHVHTVFTVLIKLIPMCKELLIDILVTQYPFYKKPAHVHEYYLHNLLWILDYLPEFKPDILHLIFTKLVLLDVNSPKEEIEQFENDHEMSDENMFIMDEINEVKLSDNNALKHPIAHTLDICLDKILNYFIMESFEGTELNWEKIKGLYQNMLTVFDKVLLPTYNTHHVQFVMFFLCSFKTTVTEAFLNYLWKKVCTPTVALVLRKTAVAYLASLVARANYVPISMLKGTLQQMSEWIHCYIQSQDANECINSDVRAHAAFYSVCQALFYVVAFRQKDLLNCRKNISFMSSLHLGKIVTSRLNPLRVCQPAVVQNFAAVARTYQLAYCYAVIEHNSRNVLPTMYQDEKGSYMTTNNLLESFFPFDPFVLKRSSSKILPYYIEYQEFKEEVQSDGKDHDVDDFLCDQNESVSKSSRFSYSSSPGFKFKN